MRWLRKLLGPHNSLILIREKISDRSALEAELKEIQKYYRFVTFSQLLSSLSSKDASGFAVFGISHARKRVLHEFRDFLGNLSVPMSIFVDPECVGSNRLPLLDELKIYEKHFPLQSKTLEEVRPLCWQHPEEAEKRLNALRSELGPLPLNELDPLEFFCTWGELLQLGTLADFGLQLVYSPKQQARLQNAIKFFSTQLNRAPAGALSEMSVTDDVGALRNLGLSAVIGPETGPTLPNSTLFNLPRWK